MANLTKIQLPNGALYDVVDSGARDLIRLGIRYKLVSELPVASADTMGTIYLLPVESKIAEDACDEYFTVADEDTEPVTYRWEKIGSTRIDLSDYSKKIHTHTVTSNVTTTGSEYTPTGSIEVAFEGDEGELSVKGTPTGNVSAPAIKVKNGDADADLYSMSTAGTYKQSEWTDGSYTPSKFNAGTTPVSMEVSNEILIISNATPPSYEPEKVTLPTYSKEQITLPERIKVTVESEAPAFTGNELVSSGKFTPMGDVTAEFSGDKATIVPMLLNNAVNTSPAIE